MDGEQEHRADDDTLQVYELHGMNSRNTEGGGLLVLVVQLVEMLVKEGPMVNSMMPVSKVILLGDDVCF